MSARLQQHDTQPPNGCLHFSCSRLVEAVSIMRKILKALPSGHCADFHHAKKDQHGYHEPCPVAERYRKMVERAEAFVASANTPAQDNQNRP